MFHVDSKSLIHRLDGTCLKAFGMAVEDAEKRTNVQLEPEHLLLQLHQPIHDDLIRIYQRFGIDPKNAAEQMERGLSWFQKGRAGIAPCSPFLLEVLQDAWLFTSIDLGRPQIRPGTILLATLSHRMGSRLSDGWQEISRVSVATLRTEYSSIVPPCTPTQRLPEDGRPPSEDDLDVAFHLIFEEAQDGMARLFATASNHELLGSGMAEIRRYLHYLAIRSLEAAYVNAPGGEE